MTVAAPAWLRRAREAGLREVDVEPDRELRRVDHREGDVGERRHDEAGVEHHHRRGVLKRFFVAIS